MITSINAVLLSSPNASKLADFYKTKVGLDIKSCGKMEGCEIFGVSFGRGTTEMAVMDHSKVKGKSKQPERYIINFEVDNIKKEITKLKKAKVKITQDIYTIDGYGHIATFEDLDGNYVQFVQILYKK